MTEMNCCRLCLLPNNGEHFDIFSSIALELHMSDIISEHFKYPIGEDDSLPRFVCQGCWSTTDAFHELYLKSQSAQEVLNPLIKVEPQTDVVLENDQMLECSALEIEELKLERSEEIDIDDDQSYNDDSDGNGENEQDSSHSDEKSKGTSYSKLPKKQKKIIIKKKRDEFEELFNQHKHLFDMKCDQCATVFDSYADARKHYIEGHNVRKGYIKCCNVKLFFVNEIKNHIQKHEDPDQFKCTICSKVYSSPSTLKKHLLKHYNEKPIRVQLICDLCKKIFSSKTVLKKHLKRHVRDNDKEHKFTDFMSKNFDMKCDLCDTICCSFYDARSHYKDKHNEDNGYIKCCNRKLTASWAVKEHIKKHLSPETLKCDLCGKYMASSRLLRQHKKRHEQKMQKALLKEQMKKEQKPKERLNLICDICKKVFVSKVSLEKHLKRHVEDNEEELENTKFLSDTLDMSCDLCDAVFITFHEARRHYKQLHNNDKGYIKCCGRKMIEYWIFKQHIQSHINPDTFKCDVCDKSFSSGMVLVHHKRSHKLTMNKAFICDFCGKKFRDKTTILKHLFTMHVNTEPTHECDICHKKYRLPNLLRNHVYSVHREKKLNHTCEICGKCFHVEFQLKKHMLSHIDKSERLSLRKQCKYCGDWLMSKSAIYYHEQIHTSGVQKCQHCDMELPNKLALLGHIRHHHREHKFKCDYCGKTFSTQSTMKTHEESHTRHKEYPCKFCDKKFSVMSSRRTHVRRNHHERRNVSKK